VAADSIAPPAVWQRRGSVAGHLSEGDHARVHEAELAKRMLAPELAAALHRCPTIRAHVDHRDPIEDAMFGVCVQGLEFLVRVRG